jgi:hypothetical protein
LAKSLFGMAEAIIGNNDCYGSEAAHSCAIPS